MVSMFQSCYKLASLNISNFDTSNVTTMQSLFSRCNSLGNLDLSKFDTTKVTSMDQMFFNCYKINTKLAIRNKSMKVYSYLSILSGAARETGSKIVLDYTSETSDIVDQLIQTASSNSNISKGSLLAS